LIFNTVRRKTVRAPKLHKCWCGATVVHCYGCVTNSGCAARICRGPAMQIAEAVATSERARSRTISISVRIAADDDHFRSMAGRLVGVLLPPVPQQQQCRRHPDFAPSSARQKDATFRATARARPTRACIAPPGRGRRELAISSLPGRRWLQSTSKNAQA
jgi:hypothetical protein